MPCFRRERGVKVVPGQHGSRRPVRGCVRPLLQQGLLSAPGWLCPGTGLSCAVVNSDILTLVFIYCLCVLKLHVHVLKMQNFNLYLNSH